MKIFNWVHSKLSGKQEIKKETSNNLRQDCQREEFSDWPHELLTIGTFGNNNNLNHEGTQSTSDDHLEDINPEQVNELQKEMAQLLDKQQVDELLNILEDNDRSNSCIDESIGRSTSVVLDREKDILADQKKGSIRKKSLCFILKKMFACRNGFAPTPSLTDPIPDKSIMEKILRAILHKKIYPQNSNPKATAKKYLETNQLHASDSDDDMFDVENDGSKWVKTDSDCMLVSIFCFIFIITYSVKFF